MDQWFQDKVALVTGGADGIGRAGALLFAQRGAKVAILDIDHVKGEEVVHEICNAGGQALFIRTDVGEKADVDAAIRKIADSFGGLHLAFNNAGVTLNEDVNWDEGIFDKTMRINVKGIMNCLTAELPFMEKAGGGAIVNTASTSGFMASTTAPMPAYTASKHAIVGLTRTAGLAYVRKNIRVNCICPHVTDTAIVRKVTELSEGMKDFLENASPMGRMARPEEVAEAVMWLCSDLASFVNAHPLVIDGGFLAQ